MNVSSIENGTPKNCLMNWIVNKIYLDLSTNMPHYKYGF